MRYSTTFKWTTQSGALKERSIVEDCREVGMEYLFHCIEEPHTMSVTFYHRVSRFIQEIADAMGLTLTVNEETLAFGETASFTVSGDIRFILPAWYWMVLALRIPAECEFPTFLAVLESAAGEAGTRWNTNKLLFNNMFYSDNNCARESFRRWGDFCKERKTPTTVQMLNAGGLLVCYDD